MKSANQDRDFLKNFLIESSRLRHAKYLGISDLQAIDCTESVKSGLPQSERISTVVLAGENSSITVRVHFEYGTAAVWAAQYMSIDIDELADGLAIDFFREFANLQGGYLRGILESIGMKFTLGVPFVTLESDTAANSADSHVIAWQLTDGHESVICSVEFSGFDWSLLEARQSHLEQSTLEDIYRLKSNDGSVFEFL